MTDMHSTKHSGGDKRKRRSRFKVVDKNVGKSSSLHDEKVSTSSKNSTRGQSTSNDHASEWKESLSKRRRLESDLGNSVENGSTENDSHSDLSTCESVSERTNDDSETSESQTDTLEDDVVNFELSVDEDGKIILDESGLEIGHRIAKKFEDNNVYFGKIVEKFEHKTGRLWRVSYDDGDSEDLYEDEIRDALLLHKEYRQREFSDILWFSKVVVLRHQFMVEKDNFLSNLPDRIKANFLGLGFAKWGCKYLPVMYLGPYDVSPGAIRNDWMENYRKHKDSIDQMPRLVYWYGSKITRCFSFVDPKDCVSLSEGIERGLCKIPLDEKTNTKRAKPLPNAWQTFMRDMALKPEKRKGGPKLRENHELVENRIKLLAEVEAENRFRSTIF